MEETHDNAFCTVRQLRAHAAASFIDYVTCTIHVFSLFRPFAYTHTPSEYTIRCVVHHRFGAHSPCS